MTAGSPEALEAEYTSPGLWWLWLVWGFAWIVAALVILQFDSASIATIGIIVGMHVHLRRRPAARARRGRRPARWVWALFGVLFLIAGVICFINPEETFAGLADILGFLFLIVGVWWTIQAFLARDDEPAVVARLITGILMIILAFWTSGQFFIEKAYTLLVFAGIWATDAGVGDIVRAFQRRGPCAQP